MSKQLSLSAAFSAFVMVLFALTAQAELPAYANGAPMGPAAPLAMPFQAAN